MDSQPSQSGRFLGEPNSLGRTSSSSSKSVIDGTSQSLASILNNPHNSDASWLGWWSSAPSLTIPEFAPIPSAKAASAVSRLDFNNYLSPISEHYNRFEDIRDHTSKETLDLESIGGQGEALVACLREVPALYFKEDFALEDGGTFKAACPFSSFLENLALQEKLSHYLDVVELHLVKEISLRSNSFFEAQGQLEDLNVKIVEGCSRIRELKETIRLLDVDLVDSAMKIQDLNTTRSNLVALQQKLTLILYVNQALSALKLLVASADCAGALDVTDDLQHLLDGDQLAGLHCFRHLRDHVAAATDSINSILSAEFMHASVHDARHTDAIIISNAKSRATIPSNGKDYQLILNEEESVDFREHLLPFIIGLLRTAKLPSVLRTYRDNLTSDMKSAIKNAVAELLPVLVSRSLDSEFGSGERTSDSDGGGSSLASKLRSLSSESFVQLLDAIFKVVLAHLVRAAEVKKGIEWIMCNLDDHYAANSVAAAIAHGAAHDIDGHTGSLLPFSTQTMVSKAPTSHGKASDSMGPSNMSKNFKADVLRENTEAVFAACDAAHGRWAKLLGVRALLHPKLRLQDFLSIFNISQDFITATEKIGGRLGYSIRGTLQSQAKAFIEFQHESRMAKIKAVLDQETWVEVDVPEEFQTIVNCLFDVASSTTKSMSDSSSLPRQNVDTEKASSENVLESTDSVGSMNGVKTKLSLDEAKDKVEVSSSPDQNNSNVAKERGKSTSQALLYGGVGYHMVNCGLILLKMLSEYIDMNNCMPSLSPEIVHRVVEILKFFNTRTCQLVLGAGAMQVSGLKSITSKHLALASQVISFSYAIIPDIRQTLFLKVPETRKQLLLSEIDRVAQDFKVHRDEIHSKLVQIMRERLLVHLRGLPQIVESWNRAEDNDPQPSQFARSLTKEVGYLQRVLSRTLHEADVQAIFRQVVVIFHAQISDAFSRLELNSPQANNRLHRDILHVLGCIRSLPTGNMSNSSPPNSGKLDEFLVQKFGDAEAGQ
ncbi:hypothetical protein QQ045_031863 [Rhodiola kirilowii]